MAESSSSSGTDNTQLQQPEPPPQEEQKKNEVVVVEISDDDDDCEELTPGPAPSSENNSSLICPICLDSAVHPTKLPCGHIFCFLCVKGIAYKDNRCAMCRRDIPSQFFQHPQLVNGIEELSKTKSTVDGYQWFYEGRGGWWQYDDRTSQDIEESYKKGDKFCTILLCGYVYIVNFEHMIQQRQNDPSRVRHVKRDLATVPKKGVAGLRIIDGSSDSGQSSTVTPIINEIASTSNITSPISNIISSDVALHIASNIIDSTLVDSRDNDEIVSSNENVSANREFFEETEELLEAASESNIATLDSTTRPITTSDLFAQTLEDFRSLTIRNVIDSESDDDENQQIIL